MNYQTRYFGDQHSVVHKSVVTENSRSGEPLGTRGGFKAAGVIDLWYSSGILRGGGGGRQNSEGLSRAGKYLG
jgi:hypothetical protein